MNARLRGIAVAAVVLLTVCAASRVLDARDDHFDLPVPADRFLYLRSGRVAHVLALSFDALAADVYWIRVIQHFGGDKLASPTASNRFELLQPLLDLTTTLDPKFNVAYRFGAVFLAVPAGPNRPDQAIALFQKGLSVSPDHWQYDYDIGFIELWNYRDPKAAAIWFGKGADQPDAPNWLRHFQATTLANADRDAARPYLLDLSRSSADAWIRKMAARDLIQLDAMDQIDQLQAIVERYDQQHHAFPESWTDLTSAQMLSALPLDPVGTAYAYNAATHRVTLSPRSSLFPLPSRPWER